MEAADVQSEDFSFLEQHSFTHILLAAMPYPEGAHERLLQLQRAVTDVLDPRRSAEERTGAVRAFNRRVNRISGMGDVRQLLIEVLTSAAASHRSPAIYDELANTFLSKHGVSIITGSAAVPRLIQQQDGYLKPQVSASPYCVKDAALVWKQAFASMILCDSAHLRSFTHDELAAGIRLLQLHLLFGVPDDPQLPASVRFELMESGALSLWDQLLEHYQAKCDSTSFEDAIYGRSAQLATWHHLRGLATTERGAQGGGPQTAQVRSVTEDRSSAGMHLVLREPIPPANAQEDKEALARYQELANPIPIARLPTVPELDGHELELRAEFPWADQAVCEVMSELKTRRLFGSVEMGLAPTLLVGTPGCGKSRFVRRLAEVFGVPLCSLTFAAMPDAMALNGTARGWATGQASPLIDVMLRNRSASAVIQLDEIDKAGSAARNSVPPTVALLNLLEPENSKRWRDAFLQASCDLSKLIFIGTANSLTHISKALLSRFRVVYVPQPQPQHMKVIAKFAAKDLIMEWGLHPSLLPEFRFAEMADWGAMSAREIRELVRTELARWARENLGRQRLH